MELHDPLVHKFLDDCYSSGIKDPVRFLIDKMPRVYGFLKGAFPRNILPTDVDGEVEINGHFLRLEFKHEKCLRNGMVPRGQAQAFKSLVNTGKFTVFYIGHNSNGSVTLLDILAGSESGIKTKRIDPCDESRLRAACERWAVDVSKK